MKQTNLFDLFGIKKKKDDKSNGNNLQAPPSREQRLGSPRSDHEETKSETSATYDNSRTNMTEISLLDANSKKRKADLIVNSEKMIVEENIPIENVVKKTKLNSDSNSESSSVTITFSQESTGPQKDLSKLRKITDPEYNAYQDAPFMPSQDVPFSFLTNCFEEVSAIKGENSKDKMTEILANMFRSILYLKPDQLSLVYYFCVLRIASDYETYNDLGVGGETLVKAVAKASGKTEKFIRDSANKTGDLGKVAETGKATQSTMDKFMKKPTTKKANSVTLKHVIETFRKMPRLKGSNSNNERESLLLKLLFDCTDNEPKYIVRFVQKNLKIGAAEATMQSALVRAFLIKNYYDETNGKPKPKNWANVVPNYTTKLAVYEEIVKKAICEHPNYEGVIQGLMKVGKNIEELSNICKIEPGIPVKPMLAKPTKGISIVLQRFENMKFTCEYKYDGLRGQIHYNEGKCQIFSRNLENMTETYPDIVHFVLLSTKPDVKNFIIDSEIVAINTQTKKILPFQTLSTRSRKNVDKNAIEVQVCIYVFDIIYFNGESLLKTSFSDRRKYLNEHFKEVENKLQIAQHLDTDNFDEIQEFLNQSVKTGCEGLMVKTLDVNSTYEPSKRSFKWLKLKKDYLEEGLGDSFDLVPIGALYGTGKRGGVWGSYLLACYNPDTEKYETFCKVATGFSDENLLNFHKLFSEHIIKNPLSEYRVKQEEVDVWFEPCVVWEIRGADIQISPIYTTALGQIDSSRGLGLRFPRLIKVRDDKKPDEATDPTTIVEIYKSQAAITNAAQKFEDDEDLY